MPGPTNARPRTKRLAIDQAELESRLSYFEIGEEDLRRLASLRSFAEKHMDEIIGDLYKLILGHPESRRVFPDQASVARAQSAQRAYFLGLFVGRCDLAYVEDRLRIGSVHHQVGVLPKWYIGAYSRYMSLIFDRLEREIAEPERLRDACSSVRKLVAFDIALAMDTYIEAQLEDLERHQEAIRELSTPVIRIHERILLLPLIGPVDTVRAQQIVETVLTRIVEEQARVIIIDIAGVPVVDTKVAEHLIETTRAVRLLGAQTILTGISPVVAKTVVRLGVDIEIMRTTSRLSEGIDLARALVREGPSGRGGREGSEVLP